ncbi:unnamed protein product, partial [Polarella glacialis]
EFPRSPPFPGPLHFGYPGPGGYRSPQTPGPHFRLAGSSSNGSLRGRPVIGVVGNQQLGQSVSVNSLGSAGSDTGPGVRVPPRSQASMLGAGQALQSPAPGQGHLLSPTPPRTMHSGLTQSWPTLSPGTPSTPAMQASSASLFGRMTRNSSAASGPSLSPWQAVRAMSPALQLSNQSTYRQAPPGSWVIEEMVDFGIPEEEEDGFEKGDCKSHRCPDENDVGNWWQFWVCSDDDNNWRHCSER